MPLATPTTIDDWSTNARSSAIAINKQETPRTSGTKTPTLIGQSPVMRKLFSVIERVAPTDASVLITGATGTGKELAARAIHDMSPRRDNAFVDINCSAIPETLIEAELFGHQRGTFTGAHENRSGLFEKASGGTLFLDEVDALNLSAQAKLLRVLQERTVRRIGARANIAIDVRIISATNCDLAQAVAEGRFRPDLYYRLRVLPLHVPELCTRGDDVRLLVEHFLRVKSERNGLPLRNFTAEAMRALCEYPWPGNVRELENTIEYALAIGLEDELGVADLPPEILSAHEQASADNFRQVLQAYMNDTVPLAEIEKRYILSVLQQFGGNQVRAAAALGIDRSKLYRRLKQYGVMAVRFIQEEDLDGMQLLSGSKESFGQGSAKAQAAGKR
ncbi:MAG TPA: sigma-54 dependent transcriptional regulator [Pyrinomonadaceae bacterium]|nr:sigma-54 dependent transcriptional regulator [Pyrinomonadaceae bacterium]